MRALLYITARLERPELAPWERIGNQQGPGVLPLIPTVRNRNYFRGSGLLP